MKAADTITQNTGLTITYANTLTVNEGGFSGKRKMRNYEESFHILLCFIESPSTYPTPITNKIFHVPSMGSNSYSLAVELFKMTPTNLGGTNCESYTQAMIFDKSTTTFNEGIVSSNWQADFSLSSLISEATVNVIYKATFSAYDVPPINFEIYFCRIPEFASAKISSPDTKVFEELDYWSFDINNAGLINFNMKTVLPTQCNFSFAVSYDDSAIGAWFTFDNVNPKLTLTSTNSVTTLY